MNNIDLAAELIGLGSLLLFVGIALFFKLIPRNGFIGFRIPGASRSDENWYKINKYFGGKSVFWSTLTIAVGIAVLFLPPISHQKSQLVGMLLPACILAWTMARTLNFAKSLPDHVEEDEKWR